ncbi:hypothetical protein CP965_13015 [Halarcobacter mediterraneus]|uniref:Uncharacterized protein n=1 Tax=Halarcobacter mediterraneus TaxID=2023153 RepID=A0A4Q1AZU7_9BACT|nr:WYL domain-containing protein [Halarcobacter mediterraneus]RXK11685.1 hypothetical protein CP965_13015 [Halarcobacter mediterraneus]
MKKELEKEIRSIDFNEVEDEIERLSDKFNLSELQEEKLRQKVEEYIESLEKTCFKYKPKETNKSYILANAILEAMCINNDLNVFVDSSKFKIHQYYNEVSQEELVEKLFFKIKENKNDSTSKEALRLLKCLRLLNHKQPNYALFSKNWFKDSRYEIIDNNVLKFLTPSLLGYLGKHYDSTVSKYFENIDEVIKYIIKPSIYHNKLNFIEATIIDAINELDDLTIKIYNKDEEFSIYPMQIIYKKEGHNQYKVLRYEVDEDDLKHEIDFDKIERITLKDKTYSNYEVEESSTNQKYLFNPSYSMLSVESYKKNQPSKTVLLEIDTNIVEYFQVKPLSNMKLYVTEEEKQDFSKEYGLDTLPNKCYIFAEDDKEYIISTIFHTIEYVKILEPTELNEDIVERMKIFAKKNNIDLCKEDTPPKKPIEPSDLTSIKEETNEIKENNKDIVIDKSGKMEDIKNNDSEIKFNF